MNGPTAAKGPKLPEFQVNGDLGKWGQIRIEARWFSLAGAQRIRRGGADQMWNSVGLYCTQEMDGSLVMRVIVFNPDWDTPLQIARIVSRPDDPEELLTPLGFNLDHVAVRDLG